jgi:outer membrane scaffolding protein for murein synthesis (MipA/OmpV family)
VLAFYDYRGADTGHVYPLPVPYFIYRGRFLRADRDGLHGLIVRRKSAELNVSVGATTPVSSDDSLARRGMPSLRPTVELGPSLDLHLWRSDRRRARLDLRLPTTVAITVESTPRVAGWMFAPRLNLDLADVGGHAGWRLGLLVGPLYGDRRYHDYFYGVAPRYATADRPAYQARAGYAGAQALVALSKRFPGYWIGAFARYDSLGGAGYWMGGVGVAWMISQSSRTVATDDAWP